jgi:hypothetical protein
MYVRNYSTAICGFDAAHYGVARWQVVADENVCIISYFLNREKIPI